MCESNITIKDFFDTYWANTQLTCEDRYKIVENVLGEFWADYATMPRNTVSQAITSGNHSYTTNEPIRDVEWFYSSCALKCSDCYDALANWCGSTIYKLRMYPSLNPWFLTKWEYTFCMDWKELNAHLPDWIQNGYVRYYKSFNLDKSLGDNNIIPIPKSMMYLFKKLIAKEYALLSGDMYQWIDQMYASEFRQGMDKIKDRTARQIKYIELAKDADAVKFETGFNNY